MYSELPHSPDVFSQAQDLDLPTTLLLTLVILKDTYFISYRVSKSEQEKSFALRVGCFVVTRRYITRRNKKHHRRGFALFFGDGVSLNILGEKAISFSAKVAGFPAGKRNPHANEKEVVKAAIAGATSTQWVGRAYVSSVLERGMAISQKTNEFRLQGIRAKCAMWQPWRQDPNSEIVIPRLSAV